MVDVAFLSKQLAQDGGPSVLDFDDRPPSAIAAFVDGRAVNLELAAASLDRVLAGNVAFADSA
jgi:hypothetical protein